MNCKFCGKKKEEIIIKTKRFKGRKGFIECSCITKGVKVKEL